jgi:uncharacterized SAM-binding protein YcdF (DUF218 family)
LDNRIANDAGRAVGSPGEHTAEPDQKRLWGLLRRHSCWLPTWRGWLVLLAAGGLLLTVVLRSLHPFLAVNEPITDGLLVVEGWSPDYGLALAAQEFARDHYQRIYVTGGPLEYGTYLTGFKSYAEVGAATLIKLGLDSNVVQAVPAPKVRQDRTYVSAVALKHWLLAHQIKPERIHLISDGPHCRRSRLLYQKAMGKDVTIGVTSIPSKDYDEAHWWRYSAGVRSVIGEGLAYLYARFLFFPSNDS